MWNNELKLCPVCGNREIDEKAEMCSDCARQKLIDESEVTE